MTTTNHNGHRKPNRSKKSKVLALTSLTLSVGMILSESSTSVQAAQTTATQNNEEVKVIQTPSGPELPSSTDKPLNSSNHTYQHNIDEYGIFDNIGNTVSHGWNAIKHKAHQLISGDKDSDSKVKPIENVTIPIQTNRGQQFVQITHLEVGPAKPFNVPDIPGYTPSQKTVDIQQNSTTGKAEFTKPTTIIYTANSVTKNITINTNQKEAIVFPNVKLTFNSPTTLMIKNRPGYESDLKSITISLDEHNKIIVPLDKNDNIIVPSDTSNNVVVPNKLTVTFTAAQYTADVTIHSNLGDQVVKNVTGTYTKPLNITVPQKDGYTADKETVPATVNPDRTITTNETITYKKIETPKPAEPSKPDTPSNPSGNQQQNEANVSDQTSHVTVPDSNNQDSNGSTNDSNDTSDDNTSDDSNDISSNDSAEDSNEVSDDNSDDASSNNDDHDTIQTDTGSEHKANVTFNHVANDITIDFKNSWINIYQTDGEIESNRTILSGANLHSDETMIRDGETYYQIGADDWIKASDAYAYTPQNHIVTTTAGSIKALFNSKGETANRSLKANTAWKSDRTIQINGKTYYRVSTDEFVSADDVTVK